MQNENVKIVELSKKLKDLVQKTYKLLDDTDCQDIKEKLEAELADLKNRVELKLAFVGQYSSGKSTIISALTGNRDIKIDANVATDTVSEYNWNNIVLMDTPGILAGKLEKHDERTKEALKSCDLIVYVLTSQLFDDIIFENFIDLAYKQNLKDKMLIAINKMSMEAGEFETLKKNYILSIKESFKERGYEFDFKIVFIDAEDYIEGKESNDEDFIQLSNFNSFIATLNDFVEEKGLIKKQFDTPVRLLKGNVADIVISKVSPELNDFSVHYENRIQKSLRDIKRSYSLLLNKFEDEVIKESYAVSGMIGGVEGVVLEDECRKLSHYIEEKINSMTQEIESLVEREYSSLMYSVEEFNNKESFILFNKQLDAKINAPSISKEELSNLKKQKNFINQISEGGRKVVGLTNNGVVGVRGLAQVSGSQMHDAVKSVGHLFGHKFKPWEAIKTANNIGKFAKFGIPFITGGASIGLGVYEAKQEKKLMRELTAAKDQFNAEFRSKIKEIRREFEKVFEDDVVGNFKEKLTTINKSKLEISKTINRNESIMKSILDLDAEYVDFIEIIEK